MLRTLLVLPDGTEIFSGPGTDNAILSTTVTQSVSSGTELEPGAVCAAALEVRIFTPEGLLQIHAGDEMTAYQVTDEGVRHLLGFFIAEKPTRPTAHTMKLTAFDRISLLDRDLSQWVAALSGWPYSLWDLAGMVCEACGLELVHTELPNGSYLVQPFSAAGLTGRKIMQWIAQAAGRFCRATAEGKLEFAWYEPVTGHAVGASEKAALAASYDEETNALTLENITAAEEGGALTLEEVTATEEDGVLTLAGDARHYYFQGGLTFEDYTVAPIEKVQIRMGAEDIGTVWPQAAGVANTYQITGNMLLQANSSEELQPVAQNLYEQLKGITYTPCTVTIPANLDICAGHILRITDRNGYTFQTYVMEKVRTGQQDKLICTGSPSRQSLSAVNEQSFTALSGKVLNLTAAVEGLKAENIAADGRSAALALTVDGLSAQAEKQAAEADTLRTQLTALEQTANAVKISVQTMQEQGVSKVTTEASYTFDDQGLRIAKAGQQMENLLDHTGMHVRRSGEVILQATADGVAATDVRVGNYLCVGENARFEDYESGRTACFWIGG